MNAEQGTTREYRGASRPTPTAGRLVETLRGSKNCDQELALYRLAAGAVVGGYLFVADSLDPHAAPDLAGSVAWLFAAFELAAIGILCHVVLRPGVSLARRLAGMLADLGALSCCMHLGGETSLPLYPVYFLAIFANGFRFGTPHLLAATDVAAASFALAAVATEFFATHPGLSLGLLGGLIVPALYICTLTIGLRTGIGAEPLTRTDITSGTGSDARGSRQATPASTEIAQDGTREPPAQSGSDGGAGEESVCRLTVLVAEDNFTTQRLIAAILERAGHAVHVVENGRAAAEAIAKGAYDAVMMDVDLPVWNGMEAAGLIRFMSTGRPRVPIVALLAQPDPSAHNRCAEADFDTWIEKPIEPARLLAVLAAIAPALGTRGASERPVAKAAAAAPAASNSSSLDVRTLESLKALGGDDFVEELAQQFIDDAAGVRRELARAAASADVHAFREHAHALRSGAANIGAQGVHDLCLAWRHIDRATLSSKGQSCLQELEREFERFGAALQDYGAYRARLRSAQTSARVEHTALAG